MNRETRLILASASPRRAELLRHAGIAFDVVPAHIVEERRPEETPESYVRRVAREKAALVAQRHTGRFVLGADTEVIVDREVLGKPRDATDAARMLRLLSGRMHRVTTAVSLLGRHGEDSRTATTEVWMAELSDDEIAQYVSTGEPMDKAGAYAIQGIASRWIPRINGCYFNVVGLPVPLLYAMLRQHGAMG